MSILALCREYGRDLSWWDGLSMDDQALYLADVRARQPKAKAREPRTRTVGR